MLDRQHVQLIVEKTIVAYLGEQGTQLRHDSLLNEEFDLDSTEMVCVAVDLERALGMSLKEIRFGGLKTPDDVAEAVCKLMAHADQKAGVL